MKKQKTQNLSSVLDADLHRLAIQLTKMGYAIVPAQPTREMVLAGMMARGAQTAYAEMIKNAPKIAGAA